GSRPAARRSRSDRSAASLRSGSIAPTPSAPASCGSPFEVDRAPALAHHLGAKTLGLMTLHQHEGSIVPYGDRVPRGEPAIVRRETELDPDLLRVRRLGMDRQAQRLRIALGDQAAPGLRAQDRLISPLLALAPNAAPTQVRLERRPVFEEETVDA